MIRTRIRADQEQDLDFLSEAELNTFLGHVVITGTEGEQDSVVLEDFNTYFPGRGLVIGIDGTTVTTGTNFVQVSGTYLGVDTLNTASGTMQIVGAGEAAVYTVGNVITVSGTPHIPSNVLPIVGAGEVVVYSGTNQTIVSGTPHLAAINTDTISDAIIGAGTVVVTSGVNTTTISGTPHTENTDTISDAIVGGENVTVVSGADTTTISSVDTDTISDAILGGDNVTVVSGASTITISSVDTDTVSDAILGAGEVVVISGTDTVVISGTPHTVNTDTDTISDAIIGGVGITVTSGTSTTTVDGHLRYTKDENDAIIGGENVTVVSGADTITISSIDTDTISDAIIGGENVTVVSGADTITISSVDTDTISDALIAGHGIIITSGTDTILIDSFDDDDVDAITVSGVTFTGTVGLETVGGSSLIPDEDNNTITISGGRTVGEAVGNFFQVEFTGVGNINNTWLSVSSKDLASNLTPWVVVFPCRIAGLSYANAVAGSNVDIEIYVADEGAGSADTLIFTQALRGARTAWKSDFGESEFLLNAGDKVGLFARNAGNPKPKDMFLGLYLEVVARASDDDYENFSGNF